MQRKHGIQCNFKIDLVHYFNSQFINIAMNRNIIFLNPFCRLDPPEVELRMGVSIDGNKVKENEDLYLMCHFDANPPPHTLHFQHKV